jgi:hypothetical protein
MTTLWRIPLGLFLLFFLHEEFLCFEGATLAVLTTQLHAATVLTLAALTTQLHAATVLTLAALTTQLQRQ